MGCSIGHSAATLLMVNVDSKLIGKMLGSDGFVNFVTTYNLAVTVVLSIVTITILILLFLNVAKLSASGDNQSKRREAASGILVCLVCFAVAGGIDTIYAILLSIVFGFWG